MEKATIYDYARMCKICNNCNGCPLSFENNEKELDCEEMILKYTDKANEIILKWCKEHQIKTRQDKFLKMFPNAAISNGLLFLKPCLTNRNITCDTEKHCTQCRRKYWLAEVDENE